MKRKKAMQISAVMNTLFLCDLLGITQFASARELIARPKPPSTSTPSALALTRSLNTGTVSSLSFYPSGDKLVTAKDKMILWNLSTGEIERSTTIERYPHLEYAIVSPKGTTIATVNYDVEFEASTLALWDTRTMKVVHFIRSSEPEAVDWKDIEFSPERLSSLALASRKLITLARFTAHLEAKEALKRRKLGRKSHLPVTLEVDICK